MTRLNKGAVVLVAAGALILGFSLSGRAQDSGSPPGAAQDPGAPPADVGSPDAPATGGSPDVGSPDAPATGGSSDVGAPDATPSAGSSDDASLLLRVENLEEQIRQMNGQIEQLQFDNRKLEDQLKKFQEDVDFRFQEGGHGRVKREESGAVSTPLPPLAGDTGASTPSSPARDDAFNPNANPNAPGVPRALGTTSASTSASTDAAQTSHGDAFDPDANPNAPGAPRPLGTTPPSSATPPAGGASASASDSDAPLDLPSSGFNAATAPPASSASPASPASVQPQPDTSTGPVTTPGGTIIASAEVNPTKTEFDVALGYFKQKDFDDAERSFSAFLEKNPKTHFTSDALFFLGETYYEQGRQREAAEQYLKISTDYAASPHAPEAMLRLGESLQALGAKEQACATFGEVPHKYPNASAAVKAGAEREAKRAQC
jgi:tol-pal system protein YbgF